MTAGSIFVPQIIPIRVPPPGKAKHQIDTTTPIEIKSDTQNVTVYYTLDGSKPEVVKRPGFGENSTLMYSGPIHLPEGKVSVKALAVARDGRQSAVVTKLFLVDYLPSDKPESTEDNEDNFVKEYARDISKQESDEGCSPFPNLTSTVDSAIENASKRYQALKIEGSDSHRSPKGPRFISSRLGPPSPGPELTSHRTQDQITAEGDGPRKSLSTTQISRIQRETDFLRCAQCLSPRPSDPFARFCLQCGAPVPPIPGQRLPPTEGGQMGVCIHCKTMVPVNTPTCVVCEAPVAPQLQPQASLRLKVICPSCGTGNPVNITYCVTCETRLPEPATVVLGGQSAPPLPNTNGKMVSCSKCNRVNTSDARFCDWCGAKPDPAARYLTCSCCGACSHPYANFCSSCGVFLEGPPRLNSHTSTVHSAWDAPELDHLPSFRSDSATWLPVPPSLPPGVAAVLASNRVDQQTQTAGLFYPSGTELQKKGEQAVLEMSRQEQMRDRKPLLTAISPGRGYWRKQLDHICAHLRSYAQNNTEFRALIGEPRMGKMISAIVQEDNYEVSLRINFVSAGSERSRETRMGKPLGLSKNQLLSSVTEGRNGLSGSQTSLVSENSVVSTGTFRKSRKSRANRVCEDEEKLPPSKDKQLLKEVGPEGKGQISVVQQLLDEGADPSCQDSDGRPALTVAVMNLHHEVIPLLVHKGADIDQQSGPVNNTALHEAATCGTQALQCAETLLGCNASIRRKNDKGLTVYDLAVKSGCRPLISLIAAKMGQGMLDKLSRPRNNISLDAF
ncbi:double zinc ribbon and ankyrin repeat-containing protein 1 [Megalops cyprinoides]|uniref:double zinc ribbon and ankyrin repeat-containing protein 1 n=1 Tax=Megalops cyprinoides TaxID=118141 RepID=UPI00186420E6|nr:double zinc ribbon and ankyrin repeat-containing protein 1 [Megalops cyprinoides]